MPYDDESLLPISALQHWLFCRRQCGLIHLEQIWRENRPPRSFGDYVVTVDDASLPEGITIEEWI